MCHWKITPNALLRQTPVSLVHQKEDVCMCVHQRNDEILHMSEEVNCIVYAAMYGLMGYLTNLTSVISLP